MKSADTGLKTRARIGWSLPPLIGLALGLGVVTLVGAVSAIIVLRDPDGGLARALPLAPSDEQRASDLIAGPAAARTEALSDAAATRALSQAPTHAVAWLELAFDDATRHGSLSAKGLEDLRRSYVFEPLGPDVSAWRVRFAFEHWSELPQPVKSDVLYEVRTLWPTKQNELRKEMEAVRSPQGRLAARFLIDDLDAPNHV